jgi:bifunctional non-homologous end joining protein LigD
VKSDDVVLDGEIVVLDSDGKSLFNELVHTRSTPIFAAFDILWLNDEDLRELPLLERKLLLRKVIRTRPKRMLFVDHIAQNGKAMFAEICKRDMEGIVAKPAISAYKSVRGQSPWLKIKNPHYSQKEGRGEMFNSRR